VLIVAGDTNLDGGRTEDMAILEELIAGLGLTDSCRALGCGVETLDRVLYRGSEGVSLEALEWSYAEEFVDGSGHDLSDHLAVRVRMAWERP
jgi:hypothetical protein